MMRIFRAGAGRDLLHLIDDSLSVMILRSTRSRLFASMAADDRPGTLKLMDHLAFDAVLSVVSHLVTPPTRTM